ncbi:MAG: methyl-accepting chemotaxis protein [Burkholderiaceae bacterium]
MATVTAIMLTGLVAVMLASMLMARHGRDQHGARLEAVVTAQGAAVSGRLIAQVQRVLSASADVRMRQAAVLAAEGRESAQRLLAEWVKRAGSDLGPSALWLARPGDLGVIAEAANDAVGEPGLDLLRALTAGRTDWLVGMPSLDAARGRIDAWVAAPVSVGPRVIAWLIGRIGAPLAMVEKMPEGLRWRLLGPEDREGEFSELIGQLTSPQSLVRSLQVDLESGPATVAGTRLGIGSSNWVLAAVLPGSGPGLGEVLVPLAWRVGAATLMIACLATVWLARRAEPATDAGVRRLLASLQSQGGGEPLAGSGSGMAGRADPAAVLDSILAERARLRDALVRAQGGAQTAIARLAEAVRQWHAEPAFGALLADEDALTSPVVVALNEGLGERVAVARELREQASLVAQANSEILAESELADDVLATQRRVLDDALPDFERLRVLLGAQAGALAQGRDGGDWHELRAAGAVPLNAVGQALARAGRVLLGTERRIKLFGERSQEIGDIVTILLTIAERTRVAALNASLQSVSHDVGAAIDGFPDEVRRLSDAARDSADQIRRQAEVIRRETAATSVVVNEAIDEIGGLQEQVADLAGRYQSALDEGQATMHGLEALDAGAAEALRLTDALLMRMNALDDAAESGGRALRRQHGQVERLADSIRAMLGRLSESPGQGG